MTARSKAKYTHKISTPPFELAFTTKLSMYSSGMNKLYLLLALTSRSKDLFQKLNVIRENSSNTENRSQDKDVDLLQFSSVTKIINIVSINPHVSRLNQSRRNG